MHRFSKDNAAMLSSEAVHMETMICSFLSVPLHDECLCHLQLRFKIGVHNNAMNVKGIESGANSTLDILFAQM